ncbi:PepSY-associated TM helix domain-containing protein [Sphingomonas sp. HITSZ_GF]|uniref:PepSY-associated TM helix domain-containing protein n=1 Tax=Sphingomonas sp. HITSZ_GF TaxID=3037247 RepID=UPI00240E05D9|nr:PepSY-associated TM helix domain-containing protein [Sphingomonas sp. HITSZ_GF]MDG2535094.1 PepSY-associated TM helix domain-containing protein [Sphingomonas sp. HITSZ_GF]
MSAIREGVRQVMAWLHGWTGLLLGWVLFVMCLAGTLSVFKSEIGQWMRPENAAKVDPADSVQAAVNWLGKNTKDTNAWYFNVPNGRMNTVEATYDTGGAYLYRALDPVSGAPAARETLGGEFFYRLHFELELPYPWGRLLASIAGMVMLVALITGIIAHRRIFKDYFTFRPAKGQRSWLDGHNALGVLATPFHLMITFTGIVTLASLNMPWGITANYGNDLAAVYHDLSPGVAERAKANAPAPLAPVAPMLREAQRQLGGTLGRVYVINPGDRNAVVTAFRSDADQLGFNPGAMSFGGVTGKPLSKWVENRGAVQTYNVVYGLHMARFAPIATRWLYFLGGAMLTLAIATGLVLWIVKRRERAPLSLGNRILERLNAGVIGGVPLGCAAYLLANRVLALGLAGRAEMEVSVALWTAAAAVLIGAALPPRWSWPLLTGATATACALAALLPFSPSIVSAVLLVTAAALAWLAVQQRRGPKQRPERKRRTA